MRRTVTPLVLFAFLLFVSACDGTGPYPEEPRRLLPLEVGAKWTLTEATHYTGFSYPPSEPFTKPVENPRTVTLEVTRDTLVGGERWFTFQSDADTTLIGRGFPVNHHDLLMTQEPRSMEVYWYTNRDDGLYRMLSGETPQLLYSVDAAPGDTFIDRSDYAVVLEDSSDTYDLPSVGKVATHSYERTPRRYKDYSGDEGEVAVPIALNDYLSPDLGIVALDEIRYHNAGFDYEGMWFPALVIRWELVSYEKP